MDQRRVGSGVLAVLAVLLMALLGGCGSSSESRSPATGTNLSAATPVGLNTCTACHTEVTSDWLNSKHANLNYPGNLYSAGSPTIGQTGIGGANCTKNCHDPYSDSNNLTAGYTGVAGITRPVVGCEACHGPGSLHAPEGGAGPISLLSGTYLNTSYTIGAAQVSGQFMMCTSCHELLNTAGTGTLIAAHDPTTSNPTPTGSQYVITDTHFATPGDWSLGANSRDITGYAMDFAGKTVCIDCHNPHTSSADINREWASSGHADRVAADAWAHYNWSCDAAYCGGTYGDRGTCQRCHTTTGFAAYANALQKRDISAATAIWTGSSRALAYDPNFKPEMLECTGCHTDYRGNLRNPGAYKATYKIPVGGFPSDLPINAAVTYQYPDAGPSNVCMTCHSGRGSGKAIPALNTGLTATVDFGNVSFPDGHYLTGAGTMFKGTGYEFAGRVYTDPNSFAHKKIGTSAAPGTGTNGPCIGCHMERPGMSANHMFEPLTKIYTSSTGTIINVSSTICFTCHPGSSIDFGPVVMDEEENFEAAMDALQAQLANGGWTFTPSVYPYFTQTDWLSSGDADWTGNTTGKNNMGAAFNYSILYHEPGAYVHNSRYVRRLIYDSLDWLDDNQMNYSVGATLTDPSGIHAGQSYLSGAIKYLLPNGPLWYGTYPDGYGVASERP